MTFVQSVVLDRTYVADQTPCDRTLPKALVLAHAPLPS